MERIERRPSSCVAFERAKNENTVLRGRDIECIAFDGGGPRENAVVLRPYAMPLALLEAAGWVPADIVFPAHLQGPNFVVVALLRLSL